MRPGGREGPGLRGWSAEVAARPAAPPGPEEEEELREQRVKCLNNCAAAELKLGRAEEALAACEAALRICPDNGRALLRRGQVGLASPRTAPLRSARPCSLPSAPLPAAAGRAGPGRRGSARPEESPGAGPDQQGVGGGVRGRAMVPQHLVLGATGRKRIPRESVGRVSHRKPPLVRR